MKRSLPSFTVQLGWLATVALLLGLSAPALAQNADISAPSPGTRYRATVLGFTPLGWDAPYGFGLELSHFVTRQLD